MNLTGLLAELYRRLGYASGAQSAITTRLTAMLNQTHRELLGTPGLDSLRDDTITFASVANQAVYGLPPSIARIEAITDRTQMVRLQAATLSDIRDADPGLLSVGMSTHYAPRGLQQVASQPSAATGLWAVSTSASDTQSVFLESVRSGGYRAVGAPVTMTGTTRVALGSFTDHVEVTKFYLSAGAAGAVSLYDAAVNGNELARIAVGQTYARYLAVQLYPTPSSAITYYVDYVRTIPDMVNGADEPLLPEDFHTVLVDGALVKEYTTIDDNRRPAAEKAYQRGVSALKYFATCGPDVLPSRSGRAPGRSRFGAYFPVTRD